MNRVFIYWDFSNIYVAGKNLAEERNNAPHAKSRFRINFDALMMLARADRPVERAFVAGSVPPRSDSLWERLEASGVQLQLYDRGKHSDSEQEIPDGYILKLMMGDGIKYHNDPGIVVLLTGDGKGYPAGKGFHAALEFLHKRGWCVELLSWEDSCSRHMRKWVEENGIFVALDDFYKSITFLEPSRFAPGRRSAPLDLSRRPRV